jgi:putative oxidoreductase
MQKLKDFVALVGRLLLAWIFVMEGWTKIGAWNDTIGYMQAFGVSGYLLPLVILTELGGGLCVAAGFLTRLAAIALAGFCLLTALIFHRNFGDMNEVVSFNKDLALAGGFLILAAFGAGGWSVDAWWRKRRTSAP